MKTSYATKRDRNGNRYILIIDHDRRQYATTADRWYAKEDYLEVSKADRRRMLEAVQAAQYEEVYSLTAGIEA